MKGSEFKNEIKNIDARSGTNFAKLFTNMTYEDFVKFAKIIAIGLDVNHNQCDPFIRITPDKDVIDYAILLLGIKYNTRYTINEVEEILSMVML